MSIIAEELEDEIVSDEEVELIPDEDKVNEAVIPDKFKDKSLDDVVQSYLELEKEYGRKVQETGELRNIADNYLKQELERSPKQESKEVEFDDLVESPTDTINSVVEPKMQELNQRLDDMANQEELLRFQGKYPDYQEIGSNPDFVKWATENEYRSRQLQAAQGFDLQAAGDLIDMYKDTVQADKEQAKEENKQTRKKNLRDASSESGGTGETSKKIYRRADLIKMRINDPDQWEAIQTDVMAAYREGRVK